MTHGFWQYINEFRDSQRSKFALIKSNGISEVAIIIYILKSSQFSLNIVQFLELETLQFTGIILVHKKKQNPNTYKNT